MSLPGDVNNDNLINYKDANDLGHYFVGKTTEIQPEPEPESQHTAYQESAGSYFSGVIDTVLGQEYTPLTNDDLKTIVRTSVLTDLYFENEFSINTGSNSFSIAPESAEELSSLILTNVLENDYDIILDDHPILLESSNDFLEKFTNDTDYTARSNIIQADMLSYFSDQDYFSATDIFTFLEYYESLTDKNKLAKDIIQILIDNPSLKVKANGITLAFSSWQFLAGSQITDFMNTPFEPRTENLDKKLGQILLWTMGAISEDNLIVGLSTKVKDIRFDFSKQPLGDYIYGMSIEYGILSKLVTVSSEERTEYLTQAATRTSFSAILSLTQRELYNFPDSGLLIYDANNIDITDLHAVYSLPLEQDYIDKYQELYENFEDGIDGIQNMGVYYERYWSVIKELEYNGVTMQALRTNTEQLLINFTELIKQYEDIYKNQLKPIIANGFAGTIFTQLIYYPDSLGKWIIESFISIGSTEEPEYQPEPEPEPEPELESQLYNWTYILSIPRSTSAEKSCNPWTGVVGSEYEGTPLDISLNTLSQNGNGSDLILKFILNKNDGTKDQWIFKGFNLESSFEYDSTSVTTDEITVYAKKEEDDEWVQYNNFKYNFKPPNWEWVFCMRNLNGNILRWDDDVNSFLLYGPGPRGIYGKAGQYNNFQNWSTIDIYCTLADDSTDANNNFEYVSKLFLDNTSNKEYYEIIGTVKYIELEGGFWYISDSSGVYGSGNNAMPINLQSVISNYQGLLIKAIGYTNNDIVSFYPWVTFINTIILYDNNENVSPSRGYVENNPTLILPLQNVSLQANDWESSNTPIKYSWSFVNGEFIKSDNEYITISNLNETNTINTNFSSLPVNIKLEILDSDNNKTTTWFNIYEDTVIEPEYEIIPEPEPELNIIIPEPSIQTSNRILCLHGGGESADTFQDNISDLINELSPQYELHFINGPINPWQDLDYYYWVEDVKTSTDFTPTTSMNEADPLINAIDSWISNQEYPYTNVPPYALLGYSQGASAAFIYIGYGRAKSMGIQKVLLFNGYEELSAHNGIHNHIIYNDSSGGNSDYFDIPTYIYTSQNDTTISNTLTSELRKYFDEPPSVYNNDTSQYSGHFVPNSSNQNALNEITQFIFSDSI